MSSTDKSLSSVEELRQFEFCEDLEKRFQYHKRLVSNATLEEVIGEGVFGIVYKAREEESGKTIAIKVVSYENENSESCILREAKIHSTLNHENIIKLYKYYLKDKTLIMHMEYFAGVNLWQFVFNSCFNGKRHRVKNKILRATESAIKYIHNLNVTHGDMNGRNLMVNCEGDVKVIDFGFAKWGETKKSEDINDARDLCFWIENMNP